MFILLQPNRYILLQESWLLFSSVAQSCQTLCNPVDCSTAGFPVHHQLPELAQTHVHQACDAIQPSHPLLSPLLLPSILPTIKVFSNESVLCIGHRIGVSASASILPMNIQDCFPFRWTGVISLLSILNIYRKPPVTVYTVALKTYHGRIPALENADIFQVYPTCQTLLRTLIF